MRLARLGPPTRPAAPPRSVHIGSGRRPSTPRYRSGERLQRRPRRPGRPGPCSAGEAGRRGRGRLCSSGNDVWEGTVPAADGPGPVPHGGGGVDRPLRHLGPQGGASSWRRARTCKLEIAEGIASGCRRRRPTPTRVPAVAALKAYLAAARPAGGAGRRPSVLPGPQGAPGPDRRPRRPLWVDRERAAVGPGTSCSPARYGGLAGTAKRVPAVAAMGFDVLYLPPIHPIGTTERKGRDNALGAGPDDPGSPWAIGSAVGGHTAIDPRARQFRGFRHPARHRGRARHGGGPRLRPAVLARPSLGQGAPRVVPPPPRRHHRLRREPAQEVPGHLPDQLLARAESGPRGAVGRRARTSSISGSTRGVTSSGSTTPTPSRSLFGNGSYPPSRPIIPTSSSWPRLLPVRR